MQSRIFQDRSVPDILAQILQKEWLLDCQISLQGKYQNGTTACSTESDFAFVSRLMEEGGSATTSNILRSMRPAVAQANGNADRLFITDSPGAVAFAGETADVRYATVLAGNPRSRSSMTGANVRKSFQPHTKWTTINSKPDAKLNYRKAISGTVTVDKGEVYEYPGGYAPVRQHQSQW